MAPSRPSAVVAHAFAARLIVLGGAFGIAVLSEVQGTTAYSGRSLEALYALVLVGFLLALAWGALAAWTGRGPNLWLELAADFTLISLLVYVTGGTRSSLGLLYLIWIVYASLLGGPRAAAHALCWAGLGYAAIGLGPAMAWVPPFDPQSPVPRAEAVNTYAGHVLAFGAVAVLSWQLARQIQRGRRELDELGELHRRIVDNVATGLLSFDRQGLILSFNREAERITGYREDEVIGTPLIRLFPELASGGVLEAIEGRAGVPPEPASGVLSRVELTFADREGRQRHLGLSASMLRGVDGDVQGAVLIFQDLTHVARMEEQLRRSERLSAVGRLAAGLAHEIRNPLASLAGAVELLSADLPEADPTSRRLSEIVRRETARLNRLVGDFLAYAKPAPIAGESVKLSSLIDDVVALAEQGELGDARIRVATDPDLVVVGSCDALRQVLWNLLRNAAEASDPGGEVSVRARALDDGAEIRVEDQGCGIDPGSLERIFEPFFTTKSRGSGLGLATVHRIVESHGGRLSVHSEPGRGTTVVVTLPVPPVDAVKSDSWGSDAGSGSSPWPES